MTFFLVLFFIALATAIPTSSNDNTNWEKVATNYVSKVPLNTTTSENSGSGHGEGKGRITYGTPAKSMSSYGYQVGLLTSSTKKAGQFWCGGAIISPDYVLTAGHCLHDASNGFLYVGCLDRSRQTDDCKRIPISFADYTVHEHYNPTTTENDVALVKIPEKLKFTANIYPVALNKNPNLNPGQDCLISGWGHNENGQQPNILATANVKLMSEADCKRYFSVGPSQVCQAVTKQTGVCQGDSGGPMTINVNGKPTHIGLTSFGPADGCVNDIPRVFARTSFFGPWICKNTGVC